MALIKAIDCLNPELEHETTVGIKRLLDDLRVTTDKLVLLEKIEENILSSYYCLYTVNAAGSGPNWLFDIDALTKSMNYMPIVAGNQSNGNAGTKACDDAGKVMRYFSFGRHLDELHVTWAHLEKKQMRLRTNTKTLEDLCSQSLETASPAIHNAVTTHQVTTSHLS
ncbi:hypothetical protein Tco_0218877 [Tanacetum coccineum]